MQVTGQLTSTEQALARIHWLACNVSGPTGGMLVHRKLRRQELEQCLTHLDEARQIVSELLAQSGGRSAG